MTKELDRMVRIATSIGGQTLPDAKPWNPKNARGIVLAPLCFILPKVPGSAELISLDPGATLLGLGWRIAALSIYDSNVWNCVASDSSSSVMNGTPATTYSVTLRFRGVIERKAYTGGSNDGSYWQVGGSPDNSLGTPARLVGPNVYKLEISDPAQTFYLNRSADNSAVSIVSIDYQKTISITTGATVTLSADAVDEGAPFGTRELRHTTSVSGITDPVQPYFGQWINMDVISVV